jgi:hypothetical protein
MSFNKDETILLYNSVYRGIMNYYRFAENFNNLSSKVHYILKESCAKLLAVKFSLKTQGKVFAKYGKNLKGQDKHQFTDVILGLNPAGQAFNVNTDCSEVQLKKKKKIFAKGLSKASLENLACSVSVCGSKYRVEMHHIRIA